MSDRVFFEEFKSAQDVAVQFSIPDPLSEAVVHLAWYGYGDYEGEAFVLFEEDGKLFEVNEVNASHCSCNGLEGQWTPEETSWGAIALSVRAGHSRFRCDGGQEAFERLTALVNAHVPLPSAEANS